MAETPQGSNNAGNVITWIEKLSSIIKKIGLQNILITIVMLFVVIVVGQVAFNPEGIVKRIETVQKERHEELIAKRLSIDNEMRENLLDLKASINADRMFIFETHNGGENLNGLPFIYVDLTYSEPKKSTAWLVDEYRNVRLARYPLASKLYEETYFFLSLDEIKNIDPELYYRLDKENVKNLSMIIMYADKTPVGVIGAVFTRNENLPSKQELKKYMLQYSNTISKLLTNN